MNLLFNSKGITREQDSYKKKEKKDCLWHFMSLELLKTAAWRQWQHTMLDIWAKIGKYIKENLFLNNMVSQKITEGRFSLIQLPSVLDYTISNT